MEIINLNVVAVWVLVGGFFILAAIGLAFSIVDAIRRNGDE